MKELKNFSLFTLLLVVALPLFVLSTSTSASGQPENHAYDHFSHLSYRLILAVQKYRKNVGQQHLPLSPSLFALARTHVEDLKENFAAMSAANCTSPLSWSSSPKSKGKWKPCCAQKSGSEMLDCSVDKASELLVGYEGLAKEAVLHIGDEDSVDKILDLFLQQKNFLSIIASSGNYRFVEWKAVGAAVDGGFASIWFGNAVDKAKWHNGNSSEHSSGSPIPTPEGQKVKCDFLDGLDEGAAVIEMLSVVRAQVNITSIPIAPTLMQLARSHVKDLYAKYYARTGSENQCSELSWFNTTGYSCCVPSGPTGTDSLCVSRAPKNVANYDGDAFEIVYVDKNKDAPIEPLELLTRVMKNPVYNAVIFNERLSENQDFTYAKWLAAGAAVKGGVASIWIGDTEDLVECIEDANTKTTSKTTVVTNADGSTTTTIEKTSTSSTSSIIEEITKEEIQHVVYHRYDFAEPAYTLASFVNKYRAALQLPALSPSPSLFAVADLHVDNLIKSRAELRKKNCSSLLSWGAEVHWPECCVGNSNSNKNCSTIKPSEVTKDYHGKAFEFIIKIKKDQTPEQAFNALLKKADFKAMLKDDAVTAIGAEFDQGYASIWLGTGADSASWFKKPVASGPVKTR